MSLQGGESCNRRRAGRLILSNATFPLSPRPSRVATRRSRGTALRTSRRREVGNQGV